MAKEKIRNERLAKREALLEMGLDPYGCCFKITSSLAVALQELESTEKTVAAEGETVIEVRLAGRIVAKRDMGKSIWLDLRDRSLEKLQVNILQKRSPEIFEQFKHIDIGDFLGVEGPLKRSNKGEPTVFANSFQLLCKSLEPLPEKWHGLKDIETIYRRRYLDLATNRESLNTFVARSRIISYIRRHLDKQDFLEVETPMLQSHYGGAAAKPFLTHLNALHLDLFMRISPECYLKRLLVGGMDRVYEINRNFRNEGLDATHNPEFTMIEIYQAYADFEVMMELTEAMVSSCAQEVLGTTTVTWGKGEKAVEIKFGSPWRRLRFSDGLREAGVDPDDEQLCRRRAAEVARTDKNKAVIESMDFDHVLEFLFGELVESTLIQPTFVTHHPRGLTPLCKANSENQSIHDRFEVIVCGMELANAYSEQNDPLAQREAFEKQLQQKDAEGASYGDAIDEDFCAALEVGMPPAGGLGIGIDRLVMILTNHQTVREVILFPILKPRTPAEIATEEEEEESQEEDGQLQ